MFVADAQREPGKRFVVRADEPDGFLELDLRFRLCGELPRPGRAIFRNSSDMKTRISPVLIAFAVICVAVVQNMHAVLPPPDGGYPGGNTAEGYLALGSLTTGTYNNAVGIYSLLNLTTGSFNTANGAGALLANIADQNTATGAGALLGNTTGARNTANGAFALFRNTEGGGNTAIGSIALSNNTTGVDNTATGSGALFENVTGHFNTANGYQALAGNTAGTGNTATGHQALRQNASGDANTANGLQALFSNTSGDSNTAMGYSALSSSSTGHGNVALGVNAGIAVTTASNVICIAHNGQNVSNSCYIGKIYSNVQPQVGADPDLVTINSSGRLGRANVSSRRYKHDIKPMEKASEAIYALNPVSFRYHKQYDVTQTMAFGLIAEEVADVNPDLVGRNPEGQPESVRYEQINAMLLNA